MQCGLIQNNGQRCGAKAMKGIGLCFMHNPKMKDAQREAAAEGGSTPRRSGLDLPPIALQTVGDVVKLLAETINLVRDGQMPTNTANCLGYLSGIALKAMEANELQGRVEAIEAIINQHKIVHSS